jgi:hypothetical protein
MLAPYPPAPQTHSDIGGRARNIAVRDLGRLVPGVAEELASANLILPFLQTAAANDVRKILRLFNWARTPRPDRSSQPFHSPYSPRECPRLFQLSLLACVNYGYLGKLDGVHPADATSRVLHHETLLGIPRGVGNGLEGVSGLSRLVAAVKLAVIPSYCLRSTTG